MTTARPENVQQQGAAGGDSAGAVDQVKQAAGQVTDQATDKAGQLVEQAKQQATPQLETQKERLAGSLGTAAGALRQTGEQLRGQDQTMVAQYLDQAAERVDQLAGYLRQRRFGELIDDAERLAQRQPALFLTAAFGVGLLAARFLKSSSETRSSGQGNEQRWQRSSQNYASWPGSTPASQQRSPQPAATVPQGGTGSPSWYRTPTSNFEGGEE